MIKTRLDEIRCKIDEVYRKVGRNPSEITLVGVTKFAVIADIKEAVAAGLTDIGENKVQAARDKFPSLVDLPHPVTRHMIGHLQTNKVKAALELFDVIQSVDSLSLAAEIQKQAQKLGRVVDVLVQVDCGGEEQKFGVAPADVLALVEKFGDFPNIYLKGLMTIAPFVEEERIIRKCFRDLRQIRDTISPLLAGRPRVELKFLSMGMTHDYKIALEEGANMLRIGTAIFGEKKS